MEERWLKAWLHARGLKIEQLYPAHKVVQRWKREKRARNKAWKQRARMVGVEADEWLQRQREKDVQQREDRALAEQLTRAAQQLERECEKEQAAKRHYDALIQLQALRTGQPLPEPSPQEIPIEWTTFLATRQQWDAYISTSPQATRIPPTFPTRTFIQSNHSTSC
jgi:hypothetical protein